jgi:hypothetical protein
MIRKYSLLACVILALGIGPALAANVFVTKDSGGKSDEKPTIYNKIKPNSFTKQQQVVKYGARLNVEDLKAKSDMVAASLEEMREIGFKPSNAEEIQLYANAHRAVHQSYMYERRKALIKHFQKQDLERVKRDLLKNSPKAAFKVGKSSNKASEPDSEKPSKAKKKKLSKRPVYVKKSADEQAKPTKVFTDY